MRLLKAKYRASQHLLTLEELLDLLLEERSADEWPKLTHNQWLGQRATALKNAGLPAGAGWAVPAGCCVVGGLPLAHLPFLVAAP